MSSGHCTYTELSFPLRFLADLYNVSEEKWNIFVSMSTSHCSQGGIADVQTSVLYPAHTLFDIYQAEHLDKCKTKCNAFLLLFQRVKTFSKGGKNESQVFLRTLLCVYVFVCVCNPSALFFLKNYCLYKEVFTSCLVLQICLHKAYIYTTSLRIHVVKLIKNNIEVAELCPTLANWLPV